MPSTQHSIRGRDSGKAEIDALARRLLAVGIYAFRRSKVGPHTFRLTLDFVPPEKREALEKAWRD